MPDTTERQGAALNPVTHYILTPIFLGSLIFAIYLTARHRADNPVLYPWMIVISLALLLLNMQARLYALKLQDRVIRLEERLRLATLLPREDLRQVASLELSQLIGLRFASDAELPSLALRTAREKLSQKDIKEAIGQWRPDKLRA